MASVTNVEVVIDQKALEDAAYAQDGTKAVLQAATDDIIDNANALCAGYMTGVFHDHATGETRGPTQAEYDGNVQYRRNGYIGIVYTANYAAQKDNLENNTLLKAKG